MGKIDLIIPAYNAHSTIGRLLHSVACQSIIDQVKITIVNDCGKDYKDIIAKFSELNIQELTYEKNGGPGVARQYGIDHTNLPYIVFADADDTFSSPFALQTLVNIFEEDNEHVALSANFLEETHNPRTFLSHPNNMVWVFAKLYKREFLDKYQIRFNNTRANEDVGFNTVVHLCANEQEKIKFTDEVVYYWHNYRGSITRINNSEYALEQSFSGFTENMIWAFKYVRKVRPESNDDVDEWAIKTMAQIFVRLEETKQRNPEFAGKSFEKAVQYYKEIFADIEARYHRRYMKPLVAAHIASRHRILADVVFEETFWQFLDRCREAARD